MVDLRPGTMCLTPRCVCLAKVKEGRDDIFWISRTLTQHIRGTMCSIAVRKCLGWRDIAGIPMETHLRPRKNTSARAGQRRSREVRIPHWVAHSDMTPADARRDAQLLPVDVPLRYQTVPTPRIPAPCQNQPTQPFSLGLVCCCCLRFPEARLQGVELFRVHLYQCQTSRLVPDVLDKIQMGLKAGLHFQEKLATQYSLYWGSVGLPKALQNIYTDACLDSWALLCSNPQ